MKCFKKILSVLTSLIILSALSITSIASPAQYVTAGRWASDSIGWWWQNNDGTYPVNSWHWLDGNQDGIAECYYFDSNGYMYQNGGYGGCLTPDNYAVNASGAWVQDGFVQIKATSLGDTVEDSNDSGNSITQNVYGFNDELAMECFNLINAEREKNGVPVLKLNNDLMEACRIRAEEASHLYSHTRPNGEAFYTVLQEAGIYSYSSAGENIYYNIGSPERAVEAWMYSTGHRNNILNSNYTESAVVCYVVEGSHFPFYYWLQIFYKP